MLELVDTNFKVAATITSVTLSFTGVGLTVVPICAGIASVLSSVHKIVQKIVMNKYTKYEKQYKKDQQTFKPFDQFH